MRSRVVGAMVAAAILIGGYATVTGGGGGGGGFTPTFFVAQTAQGSGDGSSCANAKAVTAFNTAGNWGVGNSIAPGGGVGLCASGGNITTTLTAQGSGSAGNTITIQFETGAKLSQPVCGPCLSLDGRSYIVVDGNNTGIVESNANGTNLANHATSIGITAQPCSNCEIKNLTVQNIYVKVPPLGQSEISNSGENSIKFAGSNISIHDNTIHDASWSVWHEGGSGDTNVRVYNNNIYNIDHGFIQSGGDAGTIFFYNNHVHDMANWDNTPNDIHHDGIHCYTAGRGGAAKHIDDFYIYNNLFDGDAGANATGWIFMEGGTGTSATPCADATSRFWFFNNYGTYAASPSGPTAFNGVFEVNSPGIDHEYNNTEISRGANGGSSRTCAPGSVVAWRNNICSTGDQVGSVDWRSNWDSGSPSNNLYLNSTSGGSNAWFCTDSVGTNHFYGSGSFASFQTCVGGANESGSVYNSSSSLAPAVGAGANLTSLCTGNLVPLCSTRLGVARPSGGAWDIGSD